jgi:L-lactate dehydrogenase complex protein LldG
MKADLKATETNPIVESIRIALGREPGPPAEPRPAVLPPRPAKPIEDEIDLFISEVNLLSGHAERLLHKQVPQALAKLVADEEIRRAALWDTPLLADLGLASQLEKLGVEIVPAGDDKHLLATCDLGVTQADFALAETGTIGLLSSPAKPRAISLLPRVHLAIVRPEDFRPDLTQVFVEARQSGYLVLITGPSRTADIELTVTLGVHGPRSLDIWVLG